MTIALGILASDGVLVAADTEETYPGYMKLDQHKIGGVIHWEKDGLRNLLISGAGSSHYLDAFAQFIQDGVLQDVRLKAGRPSVVFGEAI